MTAIDAAPVEGIDRLPPHDLNAERAVLGAMMQSPAAIADVTPVLRPADHYRPAHQVIHEAILALDAKNEPADWVTVADALAKQGDLPRLGGPAYLHDCLQAVPTAAMAAHYARIVRDKAILRRQVEAGIRITDMAYAADGEAAEIAERARREVDGILPAAPAGGVQDIGELFYEVLGDLETAKPRGLPLPWIDLNAALNGLAAGEMVVVAARPGVGKSITGLQACAHIALHHGEPAVLFSMEMTRHEILLRLISAEARVPFHALMSRQLDDSHWARIDAVKEKITQAPLVIDDTPGCSLAYARAQLRAMARTRPARIACFDYLQLLTGGRAESRQAEVSAYARGIKHLAGEFGIPVIATAQLNRNPAHRADKRPELSDLRESGEIENASNVVILLHREDANGQESPRAGEIDFIVAKNRNGPPVTVTTAFQGHYMRVVDMAADWSPSAKASDAA